jgi:endonuclease III
MDVENMPKIVPMEEREWFVLFAICVAGKGARQAQNKLNQYLYPGVDNNIGTPFDVVRHDDDFGKLEERIKLVKLGQYKRIEKAFREVVKLDVTKDLTVGKLEAIPGIGPKTARFICLYTDANFQGVPLDTHILKYLAKNYPAFDVPKSTPPAGKRYRELEELFQYSAKRENKTVRQLDSEVWQSYARK